MYECKEQKKWAIPLFSCHIPEGAPEAVKQLLKSGQINRGAKAEEFEKQFTQMFECKYALSLNSCTSALRLAVEIAKTRNGVSNPEVITTPYTMVATNTAILEAGCRPVFVDVDYDTATIDPTKIADVMTRQTVAIMGVEYAGYPCDWNNIIKALNERSIYGQITLISDSAHALGATYDSFPIVDSVHIQCFSFQAIKALTTGDGGMLATDYDEIDAEARRRAWFGINKGRRIVDVLGARPVDIDMLGFKYAMNDLAATLGLEGLKDFVNVQKRRNLIAITYERELANVKGITLMKYDRLNNSHANWMFPIHVKNRLQFAKAMREKGIEVAVHNWNNANYHIFKCLNVLCPELPNTEKLNNDLIHIPLHAELSEDDVDYIIKTVQELKW